MHKFITIEQMHIKNKIMWRKQILCTYSVQLLYRVCAEYLYSNLLNVQVRVYCKWMYHSSWTAWAGIAQRSRSSEQQAWSLHYKNKGIMYCTVLYCIARREEICCLNNLLEGYGEDERVRGGVSRVKKRTERAP